jgi:hypothetical protein
LFVASLRCATTATLVEFSMQSVLFSITGTTFDGIALNSAASSLNVTTADPVLRLTEDAPKKDR